MSVRALGDLLTAAADVWRPLNTLNSVWPVVVFFHDVTLVPLSCLKPTARRGALCEGHEDKLISRIPSAQFFHAYGSRGAATRIVSATFMAFILSMLTVRSHTILTAFWYSPGPSSDRPSDGNEYHERVCCI